MLVFVFFSVSKTTFAHFLLEDSDTGIAASLHVSPDDDPIAGKQSIISFDFSHHGIQSEKYDFSLSVKSDVNRTEKIPVEAVSTVVMAKYTFPYQGLYNVTLDITPKDGSAGSKLTYAQRISRGEVRTYGSFGWTRISLISVPLLLLVVLIVAFNSRKRSTRRN